MRLGNASFVLDFEAVPARITQLCEMIDPVFLIPTIPPFPLLACGCSNVISRIFSAIRKGALVFSPLLFTFTFNPRGPVLLDDIRMSRQLRCVTLRWVDGFEKTLEDEWPVGG
jgi:hypothetical protein